MLHMPPLGAVYKSRSWEIDRPDPFLFPKMTISTYLSVVRHHVRPNPASPQVPRSGSNSQNQDGPVVLNGCKTAALAAAAAHREVEVVKVF